MAKAERSAAVIVAAGRGLRAGAGGPKQYRSIGGQTVIFRAMEPFCRHPQLFAVQPVVNPDDIKMFQDAVCGLRHGSPTEGGASHVVLTETVRTLDRIAAGDARGQDVRTVTRW